MKRVFSIAVISCIFALSGLFTSCKPQEDVEWLFFIKLDSSTDYMVAQDRYECIIFPTMFLVMSDDADNAHSAAFGFYGSESSALHRAKKSFKKAYQSVENSPEGAANVSDTGIKVNLCRYHDGDYLIDVMDSHTF